MKNCICIVCRKPNQIWLDFLNKVPNDVYMVINDHINLNTFKRGKVKIVEINTNECHRNGFNHANRIIQSQQDIERGFIHLPFPEVTAWDKALYYFCNLNINYDHVWFIEDDCFFIDPALFEIINSKYPNIDLLVKENNLNFEKTRWCWNHVYPFLSEPTAFSFIQTCRLSRNLLRLVNNFAKKFKRLVIIETLFNSLAMQNRLSMSHPEELNLLHALLFYNSNINHNSILAINKIYHPIKDINLHPNLRFNVDKNQPIQKRFINNHDIINLNPDEVWKIINNEIVKKNFNAELYNHYYEDDFKNRGIIKENLLHHFLFHGLREGYVSNFSFDYNKYRDTYPDLNYLCDSDLYHHQVYNGKAENRKHFIKETFEIKFF